MRETPAITVNMLLQDGATVAVYDPKVKKEDLAEALDGAHALVVLTEWDEFKTYPYHEFFALHWEDHLKPRQHGHQQEDRGAQVRLQKVTGDVRVTPAITVNMLLQDGAIVAVYDPKVKKEDV